MPFDINKYPKDWPAISKRIRNRAGEKCEECGALNYGYGYRDQSKKFQFLSFNEIEALDIIDSNSMGAKLLKIILTVAHMNHIPMDCRDENLKALCQRCHLLYDGDLHRKNSSHTREMNKTHSEQGILFGDARE